MMGVQIHRPCWEIQVWKDIVVIPCQLAKSLQVTNSSSIFILIFLKLDLDSNWNIIQQVRIITYRLDNLDRNNHGFIFEGIF